MLTNHPVVSEKRIENFQVRVFLQNEKHYFYQINLVAVLWSERSRFFVSEEDAYTAAALDIQARREKA